MGKNCMNAGWCRSPDRTIGTRRGVAEWNAFVGVQDQERWEMLPQTTNSNCSRLWNVTGAADRNTE
jgi:hypothetical protein